MASELIAVSVDCASPERLADFWAQALGYQVRRELPSGTRLIAKQEGATWLAFIRVPDAKAVKNRLHLDIQAADQQAEVERLVALGASRVNVGQAENAPHVVLADPEGNEFCVLPSSWRP